MATPVADSRPYFGFRSDGAMADSPLQQHRKTTALIEALVRRRRDTDQPPASFVPVIRAADCEAAFRCLTAWEALDDASRWSCAPTGSSAEEAIKRCGRGAGGPTSKLGWYRHEWREPRASEGHSHVTGPPPSFLAALSGVGSGAPAPPQLPAEIEAAREDF